ncbi:hypothetical protein Tdes44962_MAKER08793 [Teratosphaeria destructans]|uniref:Uncharacterized protein n=1 Tax=Teratosphaeria destructans TaxID=418781 RepID=A0A9W7SVS2_9PEZI|nr:hypothetical protein Tdes44962_MAKER08793 [Teratosphaeria destructans]
MPVGRSSGPSATPAAPPRVLPLSPSVGSLGPGERGAPAALEWSEAEDAEVEVKAPRSAWTGAEGLSDGDDAEAEISEPDTWMFGSPFSAIGAGPELVATGPAGPLAAFERGGARVQGARRKRRREGGSGDEMGEHLRCCRKKRLRSRQDSGGDASVPWAGETTDEAEAPASRNGTLFQAGGVVAAELLRRWTRVEVLT